MHRTKPTIAELTEAAARTVVAAGNQIKDGTLTGSPSPLNWVEKDDCNGDHHAIVTSEDIQSQAQILTALSESFPEAFFLTEEKEDCDSSRGRILTQTNMDLLQECTVFVVDPLDGTSFRKRQLPGWSVSIGVVSQGKHVGGAIYAPETARGLLLTGSESEVVRCEEPPGSESTTPRILARAKKESIVFIGLDLHFIEQFSQFISVFSKQVQTVSSTSCALGLAYLCTGRIDAFVQPVQSVWDWAAGYPLVLQAGGKFQFYHYRNGFPEPMDQPDLPSYSPTVRNTAFIAGNPDVVDWLFETLCRNWLS